MKANLMWSGEFQALKLVLESVGKADREKFFVRGGTIRAADDHFMVVRAFLAGAEKTPPHVEGISLVELENNPVDIYPVKIELQNEVWVFYLKCFPVRQPCEVKGIRD